MVKTMLEQMSENQLLDQIADESAFYKLSLTKFQAKFIYTIIQNQINELRERIETEPENKLYSHLISELEIVKIGLIKI